MRPMETLNTPRPVSRPRVRSVRPADTSGAVKALQLLSVEPGDVVLIRTGCAEAHEVRSVCEAVAAYLDATGLSDVLVLVVPEGAGGVSLETMDVAAMAAAGWVRAQATEDERREALRAAVCRLRDTRERMADDHRDGRPYDTEPLRGAVRAVCALADELWPRL
jgi:hypothetical protein